MGRAKKYLTVEEATEAKKASIKKWREANREKANKASLACYYKKKAEKLGTTVVTPEEQVTIT
jgi:hypothetical protein